MVAVVDGEAAVERVAALVPGIRVTADVSALAAADIVVEAIPERLARKRSVLRLADRVCPATTVFATTTTALPVSEVAAATSHPSHVAGFHMVPPTWHSRVVELVPSAVTTSGR